MTYMDTAAVLHTRDPFDGLHPNAGGYRKIAALCERSLCIFLSSSRPPSW